MAAVLTTHTTTAVVADVPAVVAALLVAAAVGLAALGCCCCAVDVVVGIWSRQAGVDTIRGQAIERGGVTRNIGENKYWILQER